MSSQSDSESEAEFDQVVRNGLLGQWPFPFYVDRWDLRQHIIRERTDRLKRILQKVPCKDAPGFQQWRSFDLGHGMNDALCFAAATGNLEAVIVLLAEGKRTSFLYESAKTQAYALAVILQRREVATYFEQNVLSQQQRKAWDWDRCPDMSDAEFDPIHHAAYGASKMPALHRKLLQAIHNGDIGKVRACLRKGARALECHRCASCGEALSWYPLEVAAGCGSSMIMSALLPTVDSRADLIDSNADRLAILHGDFCVVKQLVFHHRLSSPCLFKRAVDAASMYGKTEMVVALLQRAAAEKGHMFNDNVLEDAVDVALRGAVITRHRRLFDSVMKLTQTLPFQFCVFQKRLLVVLILENKTLAILRRCFLQSVEPSDSLRANEYYIDPEEVVRAYKWQQGARLFREAGGGRGVYGPSLQIMCRVKIRASLQEPLAKTVHELPIPFMEKDKLLFKRYT